MVDNHPATTHSAAVAYDAGGDGDVVGIDARPIHQPSVHHDEVGLRPSSDQVLVSESHSVFVAGKNI